MFKRFWYWLTGRYVQCPKVRQYSMYEDTPLVEYCQCEYGHFGKCVWPGDGT